MQYKKVWTRVSVTDKVTTPMVINYISAKEDTEKIQKNDWFIQGQIASTILHDDRPQDLHLKLYGDEYGKGTPSIDFAISPTLAGELNSKRQSVWIGIKR